MSELYNLKAGYLKFRNPVAVASMAGVTDSAFFEQCKDAGLYILGGYSLDKPTMDASKAIVERGRKEFISDDIFAHIEAELKKVSGKGVAIGINVRATEIEPLLKAAELAKKYGALLELNAHCRQEEMGAIGVGEIMLKDRVKLARIVTALKKTGVVLSLKMRSGVVDDVVLLRLLEKAGLDIAHVDAMGRNGANVNAIKKITGWHQHFHHRQQLDHGLRDRPGHVLGRLGHDLAGPSGHWPTRRSSRAWSVSPPTSSTRPAGTTRLPTFAGAATCGV